METNAPLGDTEQARAITAPVHALNTDLVLYMSSVWAMAKQRHEYETMTMLLDVKRVKYREIDMSLEENRAFREELHKKSDTKALPQLWVEGRRIGLDELREINENDEWSKVFGN